MHHVRPFHGHILRGAEDRRQVGKIFVERETKCTIVLVNAPVCLLPQTPFRKPDPKKSATPIDITSHKWYHPFVFALGHCALEQKWDNGHGENPFAKFRRQFKIVETENERKEHKTVKRS